MSEAAGEVLGECPSEEIGAYLDAELPADRAAMLEAHLADCAVCRAELNSQKLFLLELSRSLEQEPPIELPKDFTRAIVTKAESSVSGLRKRSERAAAAGIVVLLLVLAAVGFAGDWGRATAEASRPIGMFGALFEVAAGFLQSVVFAAGFVLRKVFSGTAGAVMFAVVLIASAAAGLFLFRRSRGATGEIG
jgi:anti-sigma factor RsiW